MRSITGSAVSTATVPHNSATTRNVRGVRAAPVYVYRVSDGQEIVLTSRRICWPFLLLLQNRTQRQPKSGLALLRGTSKGMELIVCVEPSRRVERACRTVVSTQVEWLKRKQFKAKRSSLKVATAVATRAHQRLPETGRGGRGRPAGGGFVETDRQIQGPIKQSSSVNCLHGVTGTYPARASAFPCQGGQATGAKLQGSCT